MPRKKMLVSLLFLALGTVAQAEPSEAPEWSLMVHSGYWKVKHDASIKTTGGIFAGGSDSMEARVTNEDCGRRIVIEAEGRRIVLNHQSGSSYAAEPESHRGEKMVLTMRWFVDVVDRNKFDMLLAMSAPGVAMPLAGSRKIRFTHTPTEPERRPECDCDELDEYLAQRVAEAEAMSRVYGNPEYWLFPMPLPPRVKWDAYMYELVLNGVLKGLSHAQAASEAVAVATAPGYGANDNAAALSDAAPPGAITNTVTCEVTLGKPDPTSRFPAIWMEELTYHESLHAKRCLDIKAQRRDALVEFAEPTTRTYAAIMNDPKEAGLEEVRAYQATIEWLKTWKRRNCGA